MSRSVSSFAAVLLQQQEDTQHQDIERHDAEYQPHARHACGGQPHEARRTAVVGSSALGFVPLPAEVIRHRLVGRTFGLHNDARRPLRRRAAAETLVRPADETLRHENRIEPVRQPDDPPPGSVPNARGPKSPRRASPGGTAPRKSGEGPASGRIRNYRGSGSCAE